MAGNLTFSKYQKVSKTTALYRKSRMKLPPLAYVLIGLVGETGEIAEKIKKMFRDKKGRLDKDERELLAKEIGDVLWYMSQLCTELNLSFEEVAELNLEKLLSRKKRGVIHGSGDER